MNLAPFQGLRYNLQKVSLQKVVTPPYDVISPEGQARYYRRHPWNFVRVVFGKRFSRDDSRNNAYGRARRTLEEWIRRGILKRDSAPSVYPYIQDYSLAGRRFQRLGIIALVKVGSNRILPHEGTREAPKKDRLRLLTAVKASLSPIFGLIPDPQGQYSDLIKRLCRSHPEEAHFTLDRVTHRLWKVSDPAEISALQRLLRNKEIVIADGHHRYEAAVAYQKRRAKRNRSRRDSPSDYAMFYLSASDAAEEAGLLPTHRVIEKVSPARVRSFIKKLSSQGLVDPISGSSLLGRLEKLRSAGRLAIGLYSGNGSGLLLKAPRRVSHELDVEWLHSEILPSLGVDLPLVSYTQDLSEGQRQVRRAPACALFVMQRPRLAQVIRRARAGQRMPGKTTYFYPKPLAGLVEYKF